MFFGLALVSLLPQVAAEPVPLTMLDRVDYPHAKCLDGTQAGYYAQEASNKEDSSKWVIYLNGGGECDTEDACRSATEGPLGSSKYFAETSDASGWYLGSDYCTKNPDMCGWNHVMDPYCTQDLHTGQVTRSELSVDNWHLYFSGHLVLEAILDDLDKRNNSLKDASDILLTGVSAGGLGVWTNVDYIAQRYPRARVTAATVAGFYFFATYYTGENATDPGGMADFREQAFPDTYRLYQSFVDEDCRDAMEGSSTGPGACLVANVSYPFVQSDSFVVQSQTDRLVTFLFSCFPCLTLYLTSCLTLLSHSTVFCHLSSVSTVLPCAAKPTALQCCANRPRLLAWRLHARGAGTGIHAGMGDQYVCGSSSSNGCCRVPVQASLRRLRRGLLHPRRLYQHIPYDPGN
jgi:O-palmitoleoyl-L-serine hydrolase